MRNPPCLAESGLRHFEQRQPVRAGKASVIGLFLSGLLTLPALAAAPEPSVAPEKTSEASVWDAPEPWRTDRMYFQTSVATVHFSPSPEHDNTQQLVNLEWRFQDRPRYGQWVAGFAAFDNSFGQSSQYAYAGWLARPFDGLQPLYFKITAGVLHGYKGEYQDKIPYNSSGYAPAILPSMGYCINRFCSELVLFGNSGAMLTLGITLP